MEDMMIDRDLLHEYKEDGAVVPVMADLAIANDVLNIINEHFYHSITEYCAMSRDDFLSYAYECQDKINELNIQHRFIKSELPLLSEIAGGKDLCHQSICFLRVVRPASIVGEEAADFHRETFYSDSPETTKHAINIWIPIKNVNDKNTLQYIKGSHLISDEEIKVEEIGKGVEKFSTGHKMGFFWNQKRPVSGVSTNNPSKFQFPKGLGSYALFSSMTVHGNAQNLSDNLRFVIGFAIIRKSNIVFNKQSFASKDSYFIEYK